MAKSVTAILCVTGVAALLFWLARLDRDVGGSVEMERIEAPAGESETRGDVNALARTGAAGSRSEVKGAAEEGAVDAPAASGDPQAEATDPWAARGIVLDPRGTPVAGMGIYRGVDGETPVAESGGDGRFEVTLTDSHASFMARGAGHRTVFAGAAARHLADVDAVIMAARVVRMAGVVRSTGEEPIGKARMTMNIPWEGVVGFSRSLEMSSRVDLKWSSDKDGAFDLEDVPVVTGVPLSTVADGFMAATTDVPTSDEFNVVIELKPVAARGSGDGEDEVVFFGVVNDAEGRAVEGARIFLGDERATSDGSGRWEFARGNRIRPGTLLAAVHKSAGTGTLPHDGSWNQSNGRIGPLAIELEPSDQSIEGHVVDSKGEALQGWTVEILNPTVLNLDRIPAPTLETRGAERSVRGRTSGVGRFKLTGLSDREYDIRAYNGSSYLSIVQAGVPAGTSDLELRLPEDATIEEMRVHVTTRDGLAVPNATVATRFILAESVSGFTSVNGATAITDKDGNATLSDVPRRGVALVASKPGIVNEVLDPGNEGFHGNEVEIQVDRNLEIVVDCSGMTPVPDRVRIFDQSGKPLMIASRTANGSTSSIDLSLNDGVSPVVSVSEAAVEMALMAGWEETKRVPIQLSPETITRIEVP